MTETSLYPVPIEALYPRIHQKGGSKAETLRKALSRLSLRVRILALLTHLRNALRVDTSGGARSGSRLRRARASAARSEAALYKRSEPGGGSDA